MNNIMMVYPTLEYQFTLSLWSWTLKIIVELQNLKILYFALINRKFLEV